MQVGMKQKMSLSIYFQHKNYNCRGTLKGFIQFNYLNVNLKFMEVQIVRREVVFGDKKCEPAYVARYELIDGVPTKNERIPIRFFLKSYNLTPTYPNVDNVFCVRYFLNLVIADDEENRYFKQKEICLFRLYKERKNIYNYNNNIDNEYYNNNYNNEIFITEPIYEEDFSLYYHPAFGGKNNNDNEDYDDNNIINENNFDNRNRNKNNINKNIENNNINYNRNKTYNNKNDRNIFSDNYNDEEEDKFINNNNYNNNYRRNNSNINNYNQNRNNNNMNRDKNQIINNNPSNYYSIKTKNNINSYNESNMFADDLDDNNYGLNNINDINDLAKLEKKISHSHRSNLMQSRISTEEDFKNIFNSLDKNANKEELKKNIFG